MGCVLRLNINYPEFRRYHHTFIKMNSSGDGRFSEMCCKDRTLFIGNHDGNKPYTSRLYILKTNLLLLKCELKGGKPFGKTLTCINKIPHPLSLFTLSNSLTQWILKYLRRILVYL